MSKLNIVVIADNFDPFDNRGSARNWWKNTLENGGDTVSYHSPSYLESSSQKELFENDIIIIPSDQPTSTYASLSTSNSRLNDYVEQGGVLSYSVTYSGWQGGIPPAQITIGKTTTIIDEDYQYDAFVNANSSFGDKTETRKVSANVANHAALSDGSADFNGSVETLTTAEDGQATTIKYDIEDGHLILTGLTFESPNNSTDWHPFYSDYIDYLGGLATSKSNNENDSDKDSLTDDGNKANNGKTSLLAGTDKPDILTGTSGRDQINGYAGDDVINGMGGKDTVSGGRGSDTFEIDEGKVKILDFSLAEGDVLNLYADKILSVVSRKNSTVIKHDEGKVNIVGLTPFELVDVDSLNGIKLF